MPESFGKLVLTLPDGQHQEFDLARPSVLLGRATTSDVVRNAAVNMCAKRYGKLGLKMISSQLTG